MKPKTPGEVKELGGWGVGCSTVDFGSAAYRVYRC